MKILGNLVSPAATAVNNQTTATPFLVPIGCVGLEFKTTAADVVVEVARDAVTPPTFQTSAATGFPLTANVGAGIAMPSYNAASRGVCSALSTGGATIEVWEVNG